MTKPALATQAQVKRNIKAALNAGLRVRGIAPDGTVLLADGGGPYNIVLPAEDERADWHEQSEWDD